ncbi:Vacuolar protein sorting-associated protein 51-like protein [Bienertia sinuspersici]
MPIFKVYGDSSFQDCKKASEEAMSIIVKNLQFVGWKRWGSGVGLRSAMGKLFSDSESIQTRAEAVMLLKQLDFPVDNLKDQLFEKLEQSLGDLQLHFDGKVAISSISDESEKQDSSDRIPAAHEVSTHELVEAIRAYRVIFPDSEQQLIRISHDLVIKHFGTIEKNIKYQISSAELLGMLRLVWDNVLLIDEVLPEASVADVCLEAANHAVKQYITGSFSHLLQDISDSLMKVQSNQKETVKDENLLQVILEASKKAVIQGSMGVLLDFRQLLDDSLPLLLRLRDLIVDWVQEGFQDFFRLLYNRFLLLSGKNNSGSQDSVFHDGMQGDKSIAGLVLVLSQLSVFVDQNAIPRITEASTTKFFILIMFISVTVSLYPLSNMGWSVTVLYNRRLQLHFLVVVFGDLRVAQHLFLQKFAEYTDLLLRNFCILKENENGEKGNIAVPTSQGSLSSGLDAQLLKNLIMIYKLYLRVRSDYNRFFSGYIVHVKWEERERQRDVEVISVGKEMYVTETDSMIGGIRDTLDKIRSCFLWIGRRKTVLYFVFSSLQYIKIKTLRVSVLLKKRFTTPNWIKHKEPREVHMFVDLFLQEVSFLLEGVLSEVKQLLPEGPTRKHRRSDSISNGSTTSSRSNPLRDDRSLTRSNTQKARSHLLETHLAKLFKQKMEIFTKVDATQDSVLTTIVKLCLKSLQEYVRLQTFNRSGFQQIQLDTQFLRNSIKDSVEDEAAVDFLLDEVIVAAGERCLDPIPLEPPVLDRLVQVKLEKPKEQTSASPQM